MKITLLPPPRENITNIMHHLSNLTFVHIFFLLNSMFCENSVVLLFKANIFHIIPYQLLNQFQI